MNQISDDLLNEANQAKEPPQIRVNFGLIEVDMWRCVLQKGQGKQQYDPAQHSPEQRRLAIDMTLTPLASSRFHDPIARNLIAESKEWTQIVRPSLEALHTDIRGVNGKWCQVQMVENGRTWEATNPDTGEKTTKHGTTFKFVALYQSEQECEDAAAAFFHRDGASQPSISPAASGATTNGNGAANGVHIDATRQMAAKFLPGLFKAAGQNPVKFVELIKANKLTAAHFDESSEEVAAIILGG